MYFILNRGNLRQFHRRGIASVPDLLSEGYPDMSKRNQSEPADIADRPGKNRRPSSYTGIFPNALNGICLDKRSDTTGNDLSGRGRNFHGKTFPFPDRGADAGRVTRGSSGHRIPKLFWLSE
ncbi:hypothetical protein LptCag_0731 [Leptospirillum ferriphilum]|nr:hypothetical protein LptCag_0731 [Leptospirillum ferriphilum]